MNRLYKIALLFIIIFLVGIYFTVRSIDSTLSENENSKVIYVVPISSAEKNLYL